MVGVALCVGTELVEGVFELNFAGEWGGVGGGGGCFFHGGVREEV